MWTCGCIAPPDPSQAPTNAGIVVPKVNEKGRESCFKCNKTFPRGAEPFRCSACGNLSHRKESCSGVKRGTKLNVWNCGNHGDLETSEESAEEDQIILDVTPPPTHNPPQISPRKGKCKKCKGTIRISPIPVMCMEENCGNRVHRKCSGFNQESLAKYV